MKRRKLNHGGYTLVEVLTAAVILSTSISAAVSLASTLRLQQELSWRVAVAINYQETASRLWQMGQTHQDILDMMPGTNGNPKLDEALNSPAVTDLLGPAEQDNLATLEGASTTVQVSGIPNASSGGITTFRVYRPSVR
jgi:Tfp pilus assembly protein PilV